MTIISAASIHTSDINACCEELRLFRYWSYKTKSEGAMAPLAPPVPTPLLYKVRGLSVRYVDISANNIHIKHIRTYFHVVLKK